jgi:hypothetical protein
VGSALGGQLLIRPSISPLASGNWPAALRWLGATLLAFGGVWLVLLGQCLWHVFGVLEHLPSSLDVPPAAPLAAVAAVTEVSPAVVLPPPKEAAPIREQSELAKPIDWPTPLRYQGAACKGLFVYAVSLLEGLPRASAVSFATDASSPGKYVHPGQKVGGWEVLSITDDWSGANPSVWLIHDGEVCRAHLTGNPARTPPPPPPPPPRRRRRRR